MASADLLDVQLVEASVAVDVAPVFGGAERIGGDRRRHLPVAWGERGLLDEQRLRVEAKGEKSIAARKYRKRLGVVPWIELLIGAYFAAAVYYALSNENYITVPFLVIFVLGYWYTGLMSLVQGRFERFSPGSETHTKPVPVGV